MEKKNMTNRLLVLGILLGSTLITSGCAPLVVGGVAAGNECTAKQNAEYQQTVCHVFFLHKNFMQRHQATWKALLIQSIFG